MRNFLALVGICVFACNAFAQSDRGSISGTVSDPSGAVVASAKIDARNVDNGAVYTGASTSTGNYQLVQLPTGAYQVEVTASGFKKYVAPNVVVPVATTVRLDVALEVGATNETITVTDTASLLKSESGEISHNLQTDNLNNLPILQVGANIRNPYQAASLLPGVEFQQISGSFQNIRVNGLPSNTQSLRVDGQDSTNGMWQIYTWQTQPSVDAVQEVAVQTSNFAPEWGQAGGGVFNLTMKSGTNTYHGSGFDYITNEALNAGLAFTSNAANGKPNEHIRNRTRQNDYGFSLGGPVRIPKVYNGHDKTFFFFNFEQWRNVPYTSNGLYTVPTLAMRGMTNPAGADFSNQGLNPPRTYNPGTGLATVTEGQIFDPQSNIGTFNGYVVRSPFAGNVVPTSRFDPIAAKIMSYMPLPNTGGPNAVFNNYAVPTYKVPKVQGIPSVKIDQNLSSAMKLSGYWSEVRVDSPGGDGLPDIISTRSPAKDRNHTVRLNYDYTISPTLLLHVGAGFIYEDSFTGAVSATDKSIIVPNVNNTKYLSYYSGLSAGARGGFSAPMGGYLIRDFINTRPSGNTSLTWVKNNHTLKFGGEVIVDGYESSVESFSNANFAFSQNETSQPYWQSLVGAPFNPGANFASFLLGAVDSGSTAGAPGSVPAQSRLGNHSLAGFAQDTWKVSRKLTLDYGIRYDYTMYLREQYGRVPIWSASTPNPKIISPTTGQPLDGAVIYEGSWPGHCKCYGAKNYPFGFGPRLGVAYQINSKTVFRGGAGVQYGKAPEFGWLGGSINSLVNFSTQNPYFPQFYLSQGLNVPTSYPSTDPGFYPITPASRDNTVYAIDQNAGRPARIATWSLGFQREVSKDLVIDAAYVGNRGVWEQSNISQMNDLTQQQAAKYGFNINNPADLAILSQPLSATLGKDPRVFLPYVGFPLTAPTYNVIKPFPQTNGNIGLLWSPAGKSWYDSLQVKGTKRISHGLTAQVALTWQKELTVSAENSYALFGGANGAPTFQNDVNNYNQNKYLSYQERPLELVISATYTTPRWGINKYVAAVTRDWQFSTVLRYQSGQLLQIPGTNNNYNNQIGRGGNLAERIPGVPVFLVDPNSHIDPTTQLIVNPAAFVQTPVGQFSSSTPYYNDIRWRRFPGENMSFGRNFRFGHEGRMNLQIRAEFTNIFNRIYIPAPGITSLTTATTYTPGTQILTGGFGYSNTNGGVGQQPRAGQIVGRFTF
jgi:Carboxypeptidase regulatory-like domain